MPDSQLSNVAHEGLAARMARWHTHARLCQQSLQSLLMPFKLLSPSLSYMLCNIYPMIMKSQHGFLQHQHSNSEQMEVCNWMLTLLEVTNLLSLTLRCCPYTACGMLQPRFLLLQHATPLASALNSSESSGYSGASNSGNWQGGGGGRFMLFGCSRGMHRNEHCCQVTARSGAWSYTTSTEPKALMVSGKHQLVDSNA